ncbi:MAG TPA: PA14 domain-containing protein [Chitinophagaceae bacterium]|nr:PA14 domain-containing protein [Chitinophagaceae bacterium]
MKQKLPIRKIFFLLPVLAGVFIFSRCGNNTSSLKTSNTDSLAFGDTKFLSDGLKGKIYLLAPGTPRLPDFDTLQATDTLYTRSVNVPERSWKSGFPGLPDRFEWFGIEYTGRFNVITPGRYIFRLVSDDGSKLFIDDSLIINNDGLHGAASKTGIVDISDAEHQIKIQYMQGPRWSIALQLFAKPDNGKETIFPGKYFIISSGKGFFLQNLIYFASAIVLVVLLIIVFALRNKKKKIR